MFLNFIPFAISFKKFGDEIQLARRQGNLRPRQQILRSILFFNTLILFVTIPIALQADDLRLPVKIFAIVMTFVAMGIITSLAAVLGTYVSIWLLKRFWHFESRT
jgi:hypothetical protein